MTRIQFLILLYKKLFRPALLMLAAWFAVMTVMIVVDITRSITKEGYWLIATYIAYMVGIAVLLLVMQKTIDFTLKSFRLIPLPKVTLKPPKP